MKLIFVPVCGQIFFLKYAERDRLYSVKAIRIKLRFFSTDVLFRRERKKKKKKKKKRTSPKMQILCSVNWAFRNSHNNFLTVKKKAIYSRIAHFNFFNDKNMTLPCNRRRNTHDLQFGKLGYRWRASLTQVPRRLLFCSWASQWPSRPRRRRAWQRCTRSPWGPR